MPAAATKRSKLIVLPLPVDFPADVLTLSDLPDDRTLDVIVRPRAVEYELRFKDPRGTKLVGTPPDVAISEGPVKVWAEFTRNDEESETLFHGGVTVGGPVVSAAEVGALREAVRALRALQRVRLVYEPAED